jgi:hypothetical protein
MARNSGWQDFAKNFQSMYGLAKDIGQESDLEDIMNEKAVETFDDAGLSTGWTYGDKTYKDEITPDMLRGLQSDRTADVYTKWGNADKALEMRTKQADLQERRNQNRMFEDTYKTALATKDAELLRLQGLIKGQDITNVVDESKGKVTISRADLDTQKNNILLDYSKRASSGEWKDKPGAGKEFLLNAAFSTGDQQFYTMVSNMDESKINQKLNGAAQLMTSAKVALGKGQAGGQEELMALIDAQDGITGNIRFDTDESGAVSIVELDQEGNPTNAAPWAGKNWEDFSQNVMKRLDPVTALSITSKQQGVVESTAKAGLLNAQTLEALQKASGSGNSEKMAGIKATAIAKFTTEVGGAYYRAKTDAEKKRVLDIFKYELDNFDKQRNKKGGYNQQKPAPGAGGDGLNNLNNTVDGAPVVGAVTTAPPVGEVTPTPTSGISNKNSDAVPAPETKKVLTKANIAEIADLDNEVTDIKAKVVELSKVRGLQSGGKARNEIQKLRKRLVGIEQRKYKIQN